jgi:hypothetical protein
MTIRHLMAVVAIAAGFSLWWAHARELLCRGEFEFVVLLVETSMICFTSLPFVVAAYMTYRNAAHAQCLNHRCEFPSAVFDDSSDATMQST